MIGQDIPRGETLAVSRKEWELVRQVTHDLAAGKKVDEHDIADAQAIATRAGYMKTAAELGVRLSAQMYPAPGGKIPRPPAPARPPSSPVKISPKQPAQRPAPAAMQAAGSPPVEVKFNCLGWMLLGGLAGYALGASVRH
jgi:hypothetical protein